MKKTKQTATVAAIDGGWEGVEREEKSIVYRKNVKSQ